MKLDYRQPDTKVNVSKVSPLKRAGQLLLGISLAFIAIYVALGLLVNVLAPYIPESLEEKMGSAIMSEWELADGDDQIIYYQDILVKLIGEEEASKYHLRMIDEEEINAFAIPGHIIGFTRGFVEEIQDDEMIAFALGHELGHFENRDHIKGYGRVIVLYTMVNAITDSNNSVAKVLSDVLNKTEMKFSQKDELAADAYGANLVMKAYGSYDGGIEFFEILSEIYQRNKIAAYFDSHPHSDKRIEALKEL